MLNFYNPQCVNLNGGDNAETLRRRVNLLDFPKFDDCRELANGSEIRVYNTEKLPYKFFGDIRYVYRTPISHTYPSVHHKVLKTTRVKTTISHLVESGRGSLEQVNEQANRFLNGIRASISRVWCRFLGWAMFKVLRRLISRVLVSPSNLESVKKSGRGLKQFNSGLPIVYLPLHKVTKISVLFTVELQSHMDYVLIHWVLWHYKIRLPHVAAGDNLNLCGFGYVKLIRFVIVISVGFFVRLVLFFIRRHLNPNDDSTRDALYRSVLNSYLIELLKSGMSVEFFLEGTRSRFGKALLPKNGLISVIVDAVESGELKDVYLVPMSIIYDRCVEGIFVEELMGIRKPPESLLKVISGIFRSFRKKFVCGSVCMTFGSPVLLTEQLKKLKDSAIIQPNLDYATNLRSYRELLPWVEYSLAHRTKIRAIGYDCVFRANDEKPITITALLAQLFLGIYREQTVPISKVTTDLSKLTAEIERLNYEVLGWCDDCIGSERVIRECLHYLEDALEFVRDDKSGKVFLKMVDCQKSYITLAYHKNTSLSPYRLISLAAIITKLPPKNGSTITPEKQMIILSSFLRYEILICSPTERLEDHVQQALSFFDSSAPQLPAFDFSFYSNLMLPFLHTLLYTATYILKHGNRHDADSDLVFIRSLVQRMAADPTIKFPEAVNSDSIYNSLKALRTWGAVSEVRIELISNYILNQICAQIEYFITSYEK
ncbi:hypothetical protein M3Y98_00156000 [Aphelenchoides besseyi]|nr:hypothetical protein M3Y98_00156000 [Aphelenchoides besseyi]